MGYYDIRSILQDVLVILHMHCHREYQIQGSNNQAPHIVRGTGISLDTDFSVVIMVAA